MSGNKSHVMVDLETLGTVPGSVILSIGAVKFDEQGVGEPAFHQGIDIQNCIDAGLTVDGKTFKWWLQQNDAARTSLIAMTKVRLVSVLYNFSTWFQGSVYIWGNGSDFDVSLLTAAYNKVHQEPPWNFWNVRCFRTIKNEDKHIEPPVFEGVEHNALDDAHNQALHLIKIWRSKHEYNVYSEDTGD